MGNASNTRAEKRKKVAKIIIIVSLIVTWIFCAYLIVDRAQTHRGELEEGILHFIDANIPGDPPRPRNTYFQYYEEYASLLNGELGYRLFDKYLLKNSKLVKYRPRGEADYLLFADGEPVCTLTGMDMELLQKNKQPFAIVLVNIPKNKYPKDSNRYYYANTIGATYLYLADIGFSVLRVDDIAIDYEESVEVAEAYAAELTELAANGQLEVPLTEPTPERIIAR